MFALLSVTLTSLIIPAAAPAPLSDTPLYGQRLQHVQHHQVVQLVARLMIRASQRIVGSAALQLSNRTASGQLTVALQCIWLKTMAHALQVELLHVQFSCQSTQYTAIALLVHTYSTAAQQTLRVSMDYYMCICLYLVPPQLQQ
jgi:hypothetical protein